MSVKQTPFAPLPGDQRLTTFPIGRPATFKYYEHAAACYWTVKDIDPSVDAIHYETKLNEGERRFVKHVLAFFAASDKIVNINIAKRFKKDVKFLEAEYFYDFQVAMENIHAHTYSVLLDAIIPSMEERKHLLDAINTLPIIGKMSKYMFDCIDSTAPFGERLLRMACVEGIFFTGCFCVIYWLQNRGLMPALGHSNELIARDEALHTMFAMHLYSIMCPEYMLDAERVYAIFREAVELAKEFIAEALPNDLEGMNKDLMGAYIECQADNLITLIDHPPLYGSKNVFGFMVQINLTNRTNFFERRVSEYAKSKETDGGSYITNDF